jgi:hypothetical protein
MQTVELRFEPTEPKVLQSGFEHKFDGSNFFGHLCGQEIGPPPS